MDWVQEAAMPFHFQLNAVHMLIRTHLGESDKDPSCLDRHRTRLQCYKVDKNKPEYNQACELIEHSLIACVRADLKSNHLVTKHCPLLPWNSGVAAGVLVGPN